MGTGVSPGRIATKCGVIQLLVRSCGLAYLVLVSLILDGVNPSYTSSACHIRESKLSVCSSLSAVHSLIDNQTVKQPLLHFPRKEVIQPHLPIRLPCYDFTPVIIPAFGSSFLAVRSLTSGISISHGVTGGVYKTRERIHRDILIRDY